MTYELPDLPYDYGALEPHISAKIMELHHDKHHATYVKGANTALEKLDAAREAGDYATINQLTTDLAFNLGGHVNHSIFWNNLSPDGPDRPVGNLEVAIDEFYGSFADFQAAFTAAATGIQGSGWGILAWDQLGKRLNIFQLRDQQAQVPLNQTPIVLLDMWEHAFYLDYQNVKPDYVKAWWNVVNWTDAAERFENAQSPEN
ncbi:Fe-Mn family superoxide dismutase [Naumannella halotolerans]|uniref:Superoxide dismutase n=2 Tax=Naumannella halotolerans TaxID=993414 RepID=A0A4R7JC83_9ACTN|nr:Fe-Mn family superoxide dismutase [Naumannella halotolerans]